jgi:hypothetical protein
MAATMNKTANLLSELSLDASEKPSVQFTSQLAKKDNDAAKALADDEPILRANPRRFVLFPIKYHEVCNS